MDLESPGNWMDLKLLFDDQWLKQSVVLPQIEQRKGLFWVKMVYVNPGNLFQLRVRVIDSYTSRTKAEHFAVIFSRGINRDPRGTSKLDINDFNLCAN